MLPILHQRTGPLTRELLLSPGGFGLGRVPQKVQPEAVTTSVCGYCSTGCRLNLHLANNEAVGLSPSTEYPVNLGMACPKGWEALTVLDAPDRATTPLLRDGTGRQRPVDWLTAIDEFVRAFKNIQKQHGSESVAFLGTGQLPTEELAFLGSLAKFGMGMRHGDGNTRQCMATAAVAYKQSFGFDAPPYTYQDFEESDVIVLVGSNLCIAHPILWERVLRNQNDPRIIVVDPRMTETAMNATQHLPLAPKSDMDLFYGVARLLIERGWINWDYIAAHTTGFMEFSRFVQDYSLSRVVAATGLSAAAIEQFAEAIGTGKRVSFWWTMGVNQSYQGVRTAQALINLALMTGSIGRPGTGANSITGQCNAMGSRLFSNTTNLLGGHDFANAADREKVANALNINETAIPREGSWAYHEILDGVLKGKIKGLWIVCTNPAHSWINQSLCRDILDRLDFLVVQDMYHSTETAQLADLVLPAAGWGEKDGSFINSERRFGVIRQVRRAPGEALSDFRIFRLIAEAWGCGEMFREWTTPEAALRILARVSKGQPCDISAITGYQMLDEAGGIQWPFAVDGTAINNVAAHAHSESGRDGPDSSLPNSVAADDLPSEVIAKFHQQRRLFEDGRFHHADGKAKFLFDEPRPLSEPPGSAFPFILLTGRGSAVQWHTQTRTGKSDVLRKLAPQKCFVEINPQDARKLGIEPLARVQVRSQRGQLEAVAMLTPSVQCGQIFIPMHYEETNRLTDAVFDPHSKQPSYKACAVSVSPL